MNQTYDIYNSHLLPDLVSEDWSRVADALSRLGAGGPQHLSPDVARVAIGLISDADPDLRHQAIFAMGLHWHHPDAFPEIAKVLRNPREEDSVLVCAASAIGSMVHDNDALRAAGTRELLRVVANSGMTMDVRGAAYKAALWAAGRITPNEYARRPPPDHLDDIDWTWVNANRGQTAFPGDDPIKDDFDPQIPLPE